MSLSKRDLLAAIRETVLPQGRNLVDLALTTRNFIVMGLPVAVSPLAAHHLQPQIPAMSQVASSSELWCSDDEPEDHCATVDLRQGIVVTGTAGPGWVQVRDLRIS